MSVSAADLKAAGLSCGVYYTEGSDGYWLKKAEEAFRSLLPSDSLSLYVFDRLGGAEDVYGALDTFGFSADPAVVIVKDSDFKPSDRDRAALSALRTDDAYVLFLNSKFLTAAEKKRFIAINCDKSDRFNCSRYAEKLFPFGIEKDALARLAEYTDRDMARISLEADKLAAYCGDNKVSLTDVEETVAEDAELQIFSFVSCVTEGKKEKALKLLARLRKRGESPGYMLAALISQYRRMLHASLSPKTDAELAELMKVKEYAVKKARSARTVGKKQLKNIVSMLVGYELKYKSGEMSEQSAFDAAICRLIGGEVS